MNKARIKRQAGRFITSMNSGEAVRAFVPHALPPDPPLNLDGLLPVLDRANQAIGRLDGLSTVLPDTSLFLYLYVRKEAVLSSQIEGTQSSLSDLLLFENDAVPGVPFDDVSEVSNYVAAMQHGLQRLKEGFPLSLRLIREIHGILLRAGRGADRTPGEFRLTQNWIGGTRPGNAVYVPPPPEELMRCLGDFELFLHNEESRLPMLVQLGLAHVQFETIHPFLDGNGRLGRLLITLQLCQRGVLIEPLLYLSLYLKTNRARYYDLLQKVRTEGVWEEWLDFFLEGAESTARQASNTAVELLRLFAEDRTRIQALGRPAASALRLHELMQRRPVISITAASAQLGMTFPTVNTAIKRMQKLDIISEMTGRHRGRVFVYQRYMDVVSRGTEPLK